MTTAPAVAMVLALLLAPARDAIAGQGRLSLSGFLDIGVVRDGAGTWQVGPIQRSYIVLAGAEPLGDDLHATFRLGHRFETDTGAIEGNGKPLWHDSATVGVSGRFGSVQLGRRMDALYANDWVFDPWHCYDRVASPAWSLWRHNFASDPKGNAGMPEWGRLNNGIFYDSAPLGGVSLHFSGSPEFSAGDRAKAMMTALKYQGSRVVALAARGRNSAGERAGFLGLKLMYPVLSVMAARDIGTSGAARSTALTLGATYVAGDLTFRLGTGRVSSDGAVRQTMLAIGASRQLSKRFGWYVDAARKRYPTHSARTFGIGMTQRF